MRLRAFDALRTRRDIDLEAIRKAAKEANRQGGTVEAIRDAALAAASAPTKPPITEEQMQ